MTVYVISFFLLPSLLPQPLRRRPLPLYIPGSSSHPADIFLPCWKSGRSAALDVTVVSPVQQLTINNAAVTQAMLFLWWRCVKVICMTMTAIKLESLSSLWQLSRWGGWSKEAANVIKDLGKLQAHYCQLPPSHKISHIY